MPGFFWCAQDFPSFSTSSPISCKSPQFWANQDGWSPMCLSQRLKITGFKKAVQLPHRCGHNGHKQAGLIFWATLSTQVSLLLHLVYTSACMVQDVNHYHVLIPASRKVKSETSKGISQKSSLSLLLLPHAHLLELPQMAQTLAPGEAGKCLSLFDFKPS